MVDETLETLHDDENIENDIETVEEKHDMANAEQQSVASVAKTDDGIKRQPKRRGDKSNSQPSELKPKSKAAVIKDMYDLMSSMDVEELDELHKIMTDDVELEEEKEVEVPEIDFQAELDEIMSAEATLSESFKQNAATIFEATLNSKVRNEIIRLEEAYDTNLSEAIEVYKDELVSKVDSYLNYVVENYMEENKLAIENGLRTEIAENFMAKLKDVFEESYIDVPDSKIDLVDDLADQVTELEDRLNESTVKQIAMTEELEEYQKDEILREFSSDLADTEVEKLKSLVESIDFEDKESYAEKVKTIRESLFKKDVKENSLTEETSEDDEADIKEVSPVMESYLNALRRS